MNSLRRIFVSFVILFDILGFGIIFVIMSNTSQQAELIYMAEGDGAFVSVISVVGVFANVGLGYVLLRGSIASRHREATDRQERRSRITGE